MCFWAPHLSFQWLNLKEEIHEIKAPNGGVEGFLSYYCVGGGWGLGICGTHLVQFSFAFISSMIMPILLESI
jgi:hypothetical protein